MVYDEEFILLSDSRLIKDSLFHTFSVIIAFWNNFLWLNNKVLIMEKKIGNKIDVAVKSKDFL
jgi:hypothetical protein